MKFQPGQTVWIASSHFGVFPETFMNYKILLADQQKPYFMPNASMHQKYPTNVFNQIHWHDESICFSSKLAALVHLKLGLV